MTNLTNYNLTGIFQKVKIFVYISKQYEGFGLLRTTAFERTCQKINLEDMFKSISLTTLILSQDFRKGHFPEDFLKDFSKKYMKHNP